MTDTPPKTPDADADTAKRVRDHVDKLLARPPAKSTGAVDLGGRRFDYSVHAAFVPVAATGLDGASSEPEAAVLTTAYLLNGADAAQRPVCPDA